MTIPISVTVLLIDDHPMLRRGVKQLINLSAHFNVIGEAGNSEQGIELATVLKPDLILLDINMPDVNGLYTLGRLKQCQLSSRIVIFSVSDHEHDVIAALKKGADGYLLKDMEPEEFLTALEQIMQNKLTLSPSLIPILAENVRHVRPIGERHIEQLTQREQDILILIAQGFANKLIAKQLNITESTVKVHVKSILRKLSFKSRIEAAIWLLQQ